MPWDLSPWGSGLGIYEGHGFQAWWLSARNFPPSTPSWPGEATNLNRPDRRPDLGGRQRRLDPGSGGRRGDRLDSCAWSGCRAGAAGHDSTHGKLKTVQWARAYPVEYRFGNEETPESRGPTELNPDEFRVGIEAVKVRKSSILNFVFAALGFLLGSVVLRRVWSREEPAGTFPNAGLAVVGMPVTKPPANGRKADL